VLFFKPVLGSDQLLRSAQNITVHPSYEIGGDDESASRNDVCLIRIEKDLFYSGSEKLNTGSGGQKSLSFKLDNWITGSESVTDRIDIYTENFDQNGWASKTEINPKK